MGDEMFMAIITPHREQTKAMWEKRLPEIKLRGIESLIPSLPIDLIESDIGIFVAVYEDKHKLDYTHIRCAIADYRQDGDGTITSVGYGDDNFSLYGNDESLCFDPVSPVCPLQPKLYADSGGAIFGSIAVLGKLDRKGDTPPLSYEELKSFCTKSILRHCVWAKPAVSAADQPFASR